MRFSKLHLLVGLKFKKDNLLTKFDINKDMKITKIYCKVILVQPYVFLKEMWPTIKWTLRLYKTSRENFDGLLFTTLQSWLSQI